MGETHREKNIFHTSEQTHPNIWICYPQQYIRMKKFNSSTRGEKKVLSYVQLFGTPWTIYSLPGSSVHGIFFQARILESVATNTESFVNSKGL